METHLDYAKNSGSYNFEKPKCLSCFIYRFIPRKISIHRDIWRELKPFLVGTLTHFFATNFVILLLSLTLLFSWKIINIIEGITGRGIGSIEIIIYISEISSILGYAAYLFRHRRKRQVKRRLRTPM